MSTEKPRQNPPPRPRRRDTTRRLAVNTLAALGLVAILGTTTGVVIDLQDFDRTSGGYDPPYTGWTGTPIDWEAGAVTSTGFYNLGHILDVSLNCTSGMITFHAFGIARDFRTVSPRAIAVHEPRQACTRTGFTPAF